MEKCIIICSSSADPGLGNIVRDSRIMRRSFLPEERINIGHIYHKKTQPAVNKLIGFKYGLGE